MKIENTFHQASIPLRTAHLGKAAYHLCAHLHLTKYSTEEMKARYFNEIGTSIIWLKKKSGQNIFQKKQWKNLKNPTSPEVMNCMFSSQGNCFSSFSQFEMLETQKGHCV